MSETDNFKRRIWNQEKGQKDFSELILHAIKSIMYLASLQVQRSRC